jgi:tetratricopeptide (TPR) repeat protein
MRPGTPGELKELQALADRGLKAAGEAVAKYPSNAEAHYLLGSWLLYAYRVREVRQVAVDAQGSARTEVVPRVVQGLSEDVEPGLAALKRATVLEPGKGRYLVDYGAALFDCDRVPEAMGYLKGVWATQPTLMPGEKMEVGLLLSRVCEAQGRLEEAREWVYSALGVAPQNADAVQRLRQLDAAQAAAAHEEAGATEAAPEGSESSEPEGEMTTQPSEETPDQGVTSQPAEEQPQAEAAPQPEGGDGSGAEGNANAAPNAGASQSAGDIVHATATGKCYHRAGCSSLSRSDIPMTRQQAEAQGLTPCSNCNP